MNKPDTAGFWPNSFQILLMLMFWFLSSMIVTCVGKAVSTWGQLLQGWHKMSKGKKKKQKAGLSSTRTNKSRQGINRMELFQSWTRVLPMGEVYQAIMYTLPCSYQRTSFRSQPSSRTIFWLLKFQQMKLKDSIYPQEASKCEPSMSILHCKWNHSARGKHHSCICTDGLLTSRT